jgi:putative tryptophan/tyrosine transport system substrate-binding protein
MRRREFITLVGGAAAGPVAARAQKSAMPVIGFLGADTPDLYVDRLRAFRRGLGERGYVEGRNVTIEYRWAEGDNSRFPALAAELVQRQVAVLVSGGSLGGARAAKTTTTTIPIVFQLGGDPVQLGLVASMNQPGGNVTGVTSLGQELGSKRLELLHELVPMAKVVAALVNPTSPYYEAQLRDMHAASGALGLQADILRVSTEHEFDGAFTSLVQLRAGGLVINADTYFTAHGAQLAALALRHKVPTIYQFPEFTAAGGLMSYGADLKDQYRIVGDYTGRILKGEKPSDLPVQQSTKVELIINLKTARALGLDVPPPLLARADEVIE